MAFDSCDLCGLPLRHGNQTKRFAGETLHFCCQGCKMVYTMLMEAVDAPEPAQFRNTDLYQRCLAAGVIPATQDDIRRLNKTAFGIQQALPQTVPAHVLTQYFSISGMWCPACAWVIQTALEGEQGVASADCDFATDTLVCRYDPVRLDPAQVAAAVRRLGYDVQDQAHGTENSSRRRAFVRLMVSAILSMNIMMLSWALYSGFFTTINPEGIAFISWPMAVMAAIVLVYGGADAWRKAWHGVRAGAPGMEALIILGAGSAFGYSVLNLLQASLNLYFDTAAMLITLLLLGKMLETHAKEKVRADLKGFLSLQPVKVRLCSPAWPQGRFAGIEQLRPGDLFRVETDEVVPADGCVVSGKADLTIAALTGEPKPVQVGAGDAIVGGSRLVSGDLTVQARKIGPDTLLGQMIDTVQQSLMRKTAREGRTDRLLSRFIPLMILLSVATGVVVFFRGLAPDAAMIRAVTVLVIACPCALGIAIPLTRVAGIAGASRRGLLVRDFEIFEQLAPGKGKEAVVFDKTGTLTQGHWRLEHIEPKGGMTEDRIIALVLGLEKDNDHAVAAAVKRYAETRAVHPLQLTGLEVTPEGVQGFLAGSRARVGTRPFVMGHEPPDPETGNNAQALSEVYVGIDGNLCAVLHFGDTLRDGMKPFLAQLSKQGHSLHLISGDSPQATRAVAQTLGITAYQGRLLPDEKADYVAALQQQGQRVIMVGDGVNDAPAMARADLAVAVHAGAPLSQEASQVTLMRGDPAQLLDLLQWAALVDRKVRQNLWCAFAYNLVCIPVAMSGLLTPLVAVTAMLLSSLTVIGNTLLLIKHKS